MGDVRGTDDVVPRPLLQLGADVRRRRHLPYREPLLRQRKPVQGYRSHSVCKTPPWRRALHPVHLLGFIRCELPQGQCPVDNVAKLYLLVQTMLVGVPARIEGRQCQTGKTDAGQSRGTRVADSKALQHLLYAIAFPWRTRLLPKLWWCSTATPSTVRRA